MTKGCKFGQREHMRRVFEVNKEKEELKWAMSRAKRGHEVALVSQTKENLKLKTR